MKEYVSISDLIQILRANSKTIITVTVFGGVIGILIGFLSPKEYRSSALAIHSTSEESVLPGDLASLAGLAGVSIDNSSSYLISSELYSKILKSTPFAIEVLNTDFNYSDGKISLFKYFDHHNKSSLGARFIDIPLKVIEFLKEPEELTIPKFDKDGFLALTEKQRDLIDEVNSRIILEVDYSTNVMLLQVEFQDPRLAAEVAKFTLNYLDDYLIEFKIEKLNENLAFLTGQTNEAYSRYVEAQENLADFTDSNLGISKASFEVLEKRLNNELNLTFEIYSFLSQQKEKLQIEIQEQTPMFKVIDPISIPSEEYSPRKAFIIITMTFLFFGGGIIFYVMKQFFE